MEKDDLISRSALMKYINEHHCYSGLPMAAHICTMELLTYAPRVDAVEVVHGQWIPIANYVVCSRCGFEINRGEQNRTAFLIENRYCRYCGANMDGEKDEETN